jgi:hypothetical protein
MGQIFRLAAPRAKRSLHWGGKLGEILFDGSAKELVRLLVVPIRPQNSSPALEQPPVKQDSQVHCGVTQLPVISSVQNETSSLRSVKRKPDLEEVPNDYLQHHHKRAKTDSKASGHDKIDRSIRLSDLPEELHRLVFDHIEFIEDVICLSLTSRYFWGIGREHIHNYYTSFLRPWAGCYIWCFSRSGGWFRRVGRVSSDRSCRSVGSVLLVVVVMVLSQYPSVLSRLSRIRRRPMP